MPFGTEVRRLRVARGYSIEALAERTRLSANYLGGIEMNRRDPSLSTVQAIARGLGVPAGELLGDGTLGVGATVAEAARLLDRVDAEVQDAVLRLLVAVVRSAGRGSAPPPPARPPRSGSRSTAPRAR